MISILSGRIDFISGDSGDLEKLKETKANVFQIVARDLKSVP
jgi:hypothetical protein